MPTPGAVRAALVAAGLAAVVVMLGLFAAWFRVGCLAVIAVAAVVTAPARLERGGGWWWPFAGGAVASVAGAAVAQGAATAGGLIALAGGLVVVVFAAVGYPSRDG